MSVCFSFICLLASFLFFFFFNDTATTEIYTLSLHDALPILLLRLRLLHPQDQLGLGPDLVGAGEEDRKTTRLNSSHRCISYAVFCLKKKKNIKNTKLIKKKKKNKN